jgi:uncharacterized membrane protein YdjX (TVP38/TMEM64 family)
MDPISSNPAPDRHHRLHYRLGLLIAVMVSIVLLAMAWSFSSLREWLDVDRIVAALRHLASEYGLPVAALAFSAALTLAVPLTFLTLVVVVAFGPLSGFVCAMVGAQVGAVFSYALGVMLGRDIVRKLGGERVNHISQKLADRGLLAVIAVRMVPVAPFAIVNMIAGASHIRLRDLLLGTLLGMAPGTLGIALFMETILDAMRTPNVNSGIAVVLTVLLIGAGIWAARVWLRRTEKRK